VVPSASRLLAKLSQLPLRQLTTLPVVQWHVLSLKLSKAGEKKMDPVFNPNAPATVDTIRSQGGGIVGSGLVAQRLLDGNFSVESLRTQDFLRKDAWTQFDNVVIEIARHRLIGVGDLIERGLVYNVPNALGVTRIEWERIGDMGPAELNMDAVTEGRNDTLGFDLVSMPLPIVHKDFWINIRKLRASERDGMPLDTTQAEICARKVSERIESMLFLGDTTLGSNNSIYGYTTAPNRITGSTTASWATASGAQIVADVIAMIGAAKAKEMHGPFMFYVNYGAMSNLGSDYKAESDKTILQRVLEIPGVAGVKESYYVPNGDTVIGVQMTKDVVDMVDGMQPTVIQWDAMGGLVQHFKVMAIMVPRIKSTIESQSGIIHYS
jgi:uncharacterized linocin/CFP29 family protein